MKKVFIIVFVLFSFNLDGLAQDNLAVQTSKEEYTIDDEGKLVGFGITVTNNSDSPQIFLSCGPAGMDWLEVKYENDFFRMLPYSLSFKIDPPEMQNRLIIDSPNRKPHYEGYLLNANECITFSFRPMSFGKSIKFWEINASKKMISIDASYHYAYVPEEEFPNGTSKRTSSNFFRIKCTKKWYLQASKSTIVIGETEKEDLSRENKAKDVEK